jgi:hypothetical protein
MTLAEHWDGSSFSIVPTANVQGRTNVLEGTDGTSSTDVWAVGHADVTGFIGSVSLIEHWNGSSWSIVRSPNSGGQGDQNNLFDVAAISPTDAWAVGTFVGVQRSSSILLRWDGSRWRSVRANCGYGLTGVNALSSTDVWAVGGSNTCHWDGTRWTRIPAAPAPDGQSSVNLIDVSLAGHDDVWAAGNEASSCGEGQICFSGMIQHWNGQRWSVTEFFGESLDGIDAISASDVYAVGIGYGVLIVHFDGQSWDTVPAPDLSPSYGDLADVEGTSSTDLWSVGSLSPGPSTLALHAPSTSSGAVE